MLGNPEIRTSLEEVIYGRLMDTDINVRKVQTSKPIAWFCTLIIINFYLPSGKQKETATLFLEYSLYQQTQANFDPSSVFTVLIGQLE